MAAQQGRALLVKVENAPGVFVSVAGLRARSLQFQAQGGDATVTDQTNIKPGNEFHRNSSFNLLIYILGE